MDGLNPITRKEIYLAKASGDQVETPEPITREEMYLKKIAEGGGGSSLPDTPAEDGTYALQNTVAGGEGTLSWASGGSSGGGVLVVNATKSGTTITCDTKASVMYAAFEAGTPIIIKRNDGYECVCIGCMLDEYGYLFSVAFPESAAYGADTGDDYPAAYVE